MSRAEQATACVEALVAASGLPRAEARALLAQLLGLPRERLVAHPRMPVDAEAAARFAAAAARRRDGVPFAYLVGQQEFHGLAFAVDPSVLVPRPDTETLVDAVLERLRGEAGHAGVASPRILDLGTGSGCIAITLALRLHGARVAAVDASSQALEIARRNALALGAEVEWIHSDWWEALDPEARYDVIVSNPPYVAEGDPHLAALHAEPRAALVSGAHGLDALRRIVAGAPRHLAPGGLLAVEHGYDQREAVRALFVDAGFRSIEVLDDAAGVARVCLGRDTRA